MNSDFINNNVASTSSEDAISIKDKSEYKYAKEHIQKQELNKEITCDTNSNIVKAEFIGKELYIYLDNISRVSEPIIKQSEMYYNCLLIIHGARLLESESKSIIDITNEELFDIGLFYIDDHFVIEGYRDVIGLSLKSNSWVDLRYEFDDISCYFDEIYDYFSDETLC